MRVQLISICPETQMFWSADGHDARCLDPAHDHIQREVHLHCDSVRLPDGSVVVATSYDQADPYAREATPARGLYLDHRWQPPWPHEHLAWPDFGVPADPTLVSAGLRAVLSGAQKGESVEIGCLGGHGRTGTALACLAILTGCPPSEAVSWVRDTYCTEAVETAEQQDFVASFRADR